MQFTRKIILSLLFIVLCSALAFASEDSPSPEQAPLEVDWPQLELMTSAGEVRAAAKTLDDVYNILNTGLMSGSTPKLDNIYSNIASNLEFWVGSSRYSIADLQGMTWQIANSINNQLSSTNSILGNIYNNIGTTNAKLEYVFSAIEDTINIKWYPASVSYVDTSLSLRGDALTSRTSVSARQPFYIEFQSSSNLNPCLYRFTLPVKRQPPNYNGTSRYVLSSIKAYSSSSSVFTVDIPDYFIAETNNGTYLYLFDFPIRSGYFYTFEFLNNTSGFTFETSYSAEVFYIPFDTLDYQIIKTAFNQAKSADSDEKTLDQLVQISAQLSALAQSSQSGSEAAEALADYIVSPQKQAAEDASQQVINGTLSNFTGSGGGAVQKSDSDSMKDISVSVKSGINGGGSTSNATDVLNPSSVSGQTFWIWFSTTTKNNVENPYPAPVVNNTRKSSNGDEIIDTLSGYQEQLKNLLGGDSK